MKIQCNKKTFYWGITDIQDQKIFTTHSTAPKITLSKIKLPDDLRLALNKQHLAQNVSQKCKNYIKCIESLSKMKSIRREDYLIAFKICLYMEQYQSDLNLKKFSLKNYEITKFNSNMTFTITVPFLEEKTTIVSNDNVILYELDTKKKYVGMITDVIRNNVTIQLKKSSMKKIKNGEKRFDILFHSQCWPLRCCHYALSLASTFDFFEILYPRQTTNFIDWKCDIKWLNTNISENEQQQQAIKKILHMSSRPAPYIIFGPPGTGKTATIVEAICQIVKQDTRNNVLVCTSSNAAADEITQRLIKYLSAEMIYRVYGVSKDWEDVKTDIKECTSFVTDKFNGTTSIILPKEILMLRKIIISTLITSVRLAALKLPENHFSHLIIDEASQAIEPEMLIPFTLIRNEDENGISNFQTQIVIAGDYHQLGPVVCNKSIENVLGKSMLERLMVDCDLYKKKDGKYDPNYVTKLLKNYRSHEHILHVPNDFFYEKELICCGYAHTQIALNWHKLPNKNFPIIFQEVLGVEEKSSTRSVYNTAEVLVVMKYVRMLIKAKFGNYTISEKDIGIITPFKKQQQNIINKLEARGWKNIPVGTVEMFQGRERTVIILSTVRSKIFKHNNVEHIGFLSNEKRFNVAMTRAKALLIIVGNPTILRTNIYWKTLLEYCEEHDGYIHVDRCSLSPKATAILESQYQTQE